MRFYGKTFGEVFRELPIVFRALVVFSCFFLVYTVWYATRVFGGMVKDPNIVMAMDIRYVDLNASILDPSVQQDSQTGSIYLAYTHLRAGDEGARAAPGVELAWSRGQRCDKMTFGGIVFAPKADELYNAQGYPVAQGTWYYETPSIVHDPSDAARPWKIYAYKYFWPYSGDMALAKRYSMIVSAHAKDPLRGWSAEEWALSGTPQQPPSPYADIVRQHLHDLNPALAGYTAFSRPSVVSAAGTLLMTLSAFGDGNTVAAVVLLASVDHGRSWRYLGTPLTEEDAGKVGPYTRLSGATLVQQDGNVLLAAVLGDESVSGYGTFVFPFRDIAKGEIARDSKTGAPLLLNHLARLSHEPMPTGGGFATYQDVCRGEGMIVSEYSGVRSAFRLFISRMRPIGNKK